MGRQFERRTNIQDQNITVKTEGSVVEFTNENNLTTGSQTEDGTLPNENVPDGVNVVVKAKGENEAPVEINGFSLDAGQGVGLKINNLETLSLSSENPDDGVEYIMESE